MHMIIVILLFFVLSHPSASFRTTVRHLSRISNEPMNIILSAEASRLYSALQTKSMGLSFYGFVVVRTSVWAFSAIAVIIQVFYTITKLYVKYASLSSCSRHCIIDDLRFFGRAGAYNLQCHDSTLTIITL
jgi:hypothetical protein